MENEVFETEATVVEEATMEPETEGGKVNGKLIIAGGVAVCGAALYGVKKLVDKFAKPNDEKAETKAKKHLKFQMPVVLVVEEEKKDENKDKSSDDKK